MTTSPPQDTPPSAVWRLYLDQRDVFLRVFASLKRRGARIHRERESDLVHQFLVERAPQALATFQPDRGSIESWLFVVFRRFVFEQLEKEQRYDAVLNALVREPSEGQPATAEDDYDRAAVTRAIDSLSSEQRDVLRSFLTSQSLRTTARSVGRSRWQARRLLMEAVVAVGRALDVDLAALREDGAAWLLRGIRREKGKK